MSEKDLLQDFRARLKKLSSTKKKDWWERYLKYEIKFYGVNLKDIEKELDVWYRENEIEKFPYSDKMDVAYGFFHGKYAEEKLAGILFIENYMLHEINWEGELPKIEKIFDKVLIYDWNVCDWFAIKILGWMIEKYGVRAAKKISSWNSAENQWKARASLVSFARHTKMEKYQPMIKKSCKEMIRREERFCKTAVGWILRELSKTDTAYVDKFVETNIHHFTRESLENSIKYYGQKEKQKYRELLKKNRNI